MTSPAMKWAVLICLLGCVMTFPEGPPTSACESIRPGTRLGQTGLEGHVESPQNIVPTFGNLKEPPYYIHLYQERYTPGETIYVSIIANQTLGLNMFKGVIMQARRHICTSEDMTDVDSEPIGTFSIIPSSGKPSGESLLATMDCSGFEESTVAHKSPQFKINETVMWKAPDEMVGNIVFRASIVQYAHIYWTEVTSAVLLDPSAAEPPTCGASALYSLQASALCLLFTLLKYIS
ncbi:hypothetical protein CAPTEDRAFT_196662 [Capitella teleta]|uniref:Reelin domain-containing protein n=1 Tax=Capitella teleta TaxID=283909 RepID=R7T594_CAPTE|nr:hypothetical protein CAPTEDRAFT_196662 [Capitella teleta]|eukprot:ELT88248.1 hypothetical protein CAPTEDRAFT_196662 [Capitella teleta]